MIDFSLKSLFELPTDEKAKRDPEYKIVVQVKDNMHVVDVGLGDYGRKVYAGVL